MAPTKRSTKSDSPLASKVDETIAGIQASSKAKVDKVAQLASDSDSKLPRAAQFPLTVALSFALSTLGSVIMSQVSQGELQSFTRSPDTWSEVAILTCWRM